MKITAKEQNKHLRNVMRGLLVLLIVLAILA
jgi:hypothetical protein